MATRTDERSATGAVTSLGLTLNTAPDQFGFLRSSNDILDDPAALRERLDDDGYLYVRQFFPREAIIDARRSILEGICAEDEGALDSRRPLLDGIVAPDRLDAFRVDARPTFRNSQAGRRNPDKKGAFRPDLGPAPRSAQIDIFVYTFGHAHKEFTGVSGDAFRKGIWGDAYLSALTPSAGRIALSEWAIHPLPMQSPADLDGLRPLTGGTAPRAGMFYSATFDLESLGDCYVDLSTWNLGVVWVNGHNIGRHFASASPQIMLFCPATFLRKGANKIVIFDTYIMDAKDVYIELSNVRSTYARQR